MSSYGKALVAWEDLENLLIEQQIPYTSLSSTSEVNTKEFIDKQVQHTNIKAFAIIGGDGTTSSIIQQLAERNIPIAIFPAGSGNDSARMFQLTNNPSVFITSLLKGSMASIDLLNINGRYGIGSFSYTIAAIISLLSFKPFNGNLTIDGKVQNLNKVWLIACGNTTSYGTGLNICPGALPTDGLLNITLLHNTGRMDVLFRLFPALLREGPVLKKCVTYIGGKEITIDTDRPIPAIIDGEIITSTPLHITVHVNALRLILTR